MANNKSNAMVKSTLTPRKENLILCLLLSLLTFGLFYKSLDYELIVLDDVTILGQFEGARLNEADLHEAFSKPILSYYRPILSASIITDQPNGPERDPITKERIYTSYHRTNILLHWLTVLLLFWTLSRLFKNKRIGFWGSLIFAVHPILVPATVWIFGRNDSLLAIFFLPSFNFFISYLESEDKFKKLFYFVLHLLFLTACFFTKENSAVIPIIFVAYAFFIRKENVFDKRLIYCYGSWILAGIVFLIKRHAALSTIGGGEGVFRGWEAISHNYPALFVILGKIFFPIRMVLNGKFEPLSIILGVVVVVAILSLFFIKKTDKRLILFCLIWIGLFLLPTLFIYMAGSYDYLEHRAYIPIMAILIMIASLLEVFKVNTSSKYFHIICGIIVVALMVRSVLYMDKFSNASKFWAHYVEQSDRAEDYSMVASNMYSAERYDVAMEILQIGDKMYPNNADVKYGFAQHYANAKDYKKAIEYAQESLSIDPNYTKSLNCVSECYARMGILDSILPYTNRSLAVDEKQNIALNHMGFYYYNVHEFDKAKEAYEKSVAIDSTSRDSWYNLASSYYCMADYNNALRCYYKVLDIKNNKDKDALYYVINLLVGSNPNKAAQYAKMYKEQGGVLSKEVESKLPKSSNNPFSLQ